MGNVKKTTEEYYDVDGLELFLACKSLYSPKVKSLFDRHNLYNQSKIKSEVIHELEKLTNMSINEILNQTT